MTIIDQGGEDPQPKVIPPAEAEAIAGLQLLFQQGTSIQTTEAGQSVQREHPQEKQKGAGNHPQTCVDITTSPTLGHKFLPHLMDNELRYLQAYLLKYQSADNHVQVHMDVTISLILGYSYTLYLMDDRSRYSRMYLLRRQRHRFITRKRARTTYHQMGAAPIV